ncbi:polyprenyl synthetase family protein [Patescibacteria group bacterium]|nr:polyprenyl synthetase family protein [Patescibacteria group bacterium]MBU1890805.1 polyprenyl synthetase family protein [Patescibacteria group bacterium]
MNTSYTTDINKYKKKVEQRLEKYFSIEKRQARKISPFLVELVNRLEEFTLRSSSKRIRAWLVKVGYEAVGGTNPNLMVDISAAIELIHSYLLIHDDIIDQDEWRRKGLTVHKYFSKYHKKKFRKGDADHFGISMAILTGNIGCNMANTLISQSKLPDKKKAQAIDRVNRLMTETNFGQALDVYKDVKKNVTQSDIRLVQKYKTAKYSFETPLHLGAILGGANKKQLDLLSRFSLPAGMAFQIRDDVLGVFGSKKELGKPVDSDIKQGKRTLLYYYAVKQLKANDKKWLLSHYGKTGFSSVQISKIRRLFIKSKSPEKSQQLIQKYSNSAKRAIVNTRQISARSGSILLYLADYLVSRNR